MEEQEKNINEHDIDVTTNEAPHFPVLTLADTKASFYLIHVKKTPLPEDIQSSLARVFSIFIGKSLSFSKNSFPKELNHLWTSLEQAMQKHIRIIPSRFSDLKSPIESLICKMISHVDSLKISAMNNLITKLKVSLQMPEEVNHMIFSKKSISEIDSKFLETFFDKDVENLRDFVPMFKEYYSAFYKKGPSKLQPDFIETEFGVADIEFQRVRMSAQDSCRSKVFEILETFVKTLNVYWILFKRHSFLVDSRNIKTSVFLEYEVFHAYLSEDPEVFLRQVVEINKGTLFVLWSDLLSSSELFYHSEQKVHHLASFKEKEVLVASGSNDSVCLLYFKNTRTYSLVRIKSFKLDFIKDSSIALPESERVLEICFVPEIQFAFFTTNLQVYMLDDKANFNHIGSELCLVQYLPSEKVFIFASDLGVRILDSSFNEIRLIKTDGLLKLFTLDLKNPVKTVIGFKNDELLIMKYEGNSVSLVTVGLFFDCKKSQKGIKESGLLEFKNSFKVFKNKLLQNVSNLGVTDYYESFDFPDVFALYLISFKKLEARPSYNKCNHKCPLCQTSCSNELNHLDFHDGIHLNCNQNLNCIDNCRSGSHEFHYVQCPGELNCGALFYPRQVKHHELYDFYPCSLFWMGFRWVYDDIKLII